MARRLRGIKEGEPAEERPTLAPPSDYGHLVERSRHSVKTLDEVILEMLTEQSQEK